jgi:hypothetical protein
MSPLLSLPAPVSVNARLLGACAVTAVLAAVVALSAGSHARPSAAVPVTLAVGCVCAALMAHLLHASARAVGDRRLDWMAAGVTVAFAGMLTTLLGQPTMFPGDGPVEQGVDAAAARYVVWHAALLVAGALAVAAAPARPRHLVGFTAAGIALLAYASLSPTPFGGLATADGYQPALRTAVATLAAGQLLVAAAWWRRAERAPTWGEVCVIALTLLSALDAASYLLASEAYAGAWWASLTLLAAQFAVPSVGLVIGFVAVADRMRDLQEELGRGLEAERERARHEEEIAGLDRRRRAQARDRIARLADGRGLDVALQPIFALDTGGVVGAEALARFTGDDGERLPTEETFVDAHALGLGVELELAVVELALSRQDLLPDDLYLPATSRPPCSPGPSSRRSSLRTTARSSSSSPSTSRSRTTPSWTPRWAACGTTASASRWTTSGPASRPSATSPACGRRSSSSTARSCAASTRTRCASRSPRRSSPSPATSGPPSSRRASSPRTSSRASSI